MFKCHLLSPFVVQVQCTILSPANACTCFATTIDYFILQISIFSVTLGFSARDQEIVTSYELCHSCWSHLVDFRVSTGRFRPLLTLPFFQLLFSLHALKSLSGLFPMLRNYLRHSILWCFYMSCLTVMTSLSFHNPFFCLHYGLCFDFLDCKWQLWLNKVTFPS